MSMRDFERDMRYMVGHISSAYCDVMIRAQLFHILSYTPIATNVMMTRIFFVGDSSLYAILMKGLAYAVTNTTEVVCIGQDRHCSIYPYDSWTSVLQRVSQSIEVQLVMLDRYVDDMYWYLGHAVHYLGETCMVDIRACQDRFVDALLQQVLVSTPVSVIYVIDTTRRGVLHVTASLYEEAELTPYIHWHIKKQHISYTSHQPSLMGVG